MKRFVVGACAVAFCALPSTSPTPSAASDLRALPMQFELRQEGPSEACRPNCRTWVSATGAITADTPRDFEAFAKTRNIRGTTLVLDSDGGSVLGALALGRTVRKLGMMTTVGKTVELPPANGERRAQIAPNAYCESMCAFVLLAGVERHVPAEARVLVHQIWLGDRRDDPTAAHYSAEDLVLVQRDIGRLAQYTVEMGGGDRPARDRAEDSALGADAAAVARGTARHEDHHWRQRAGGQFRRRDGCAADVERRPRHASGA